MTLYGGSCSFVSSFIPTLLQPGVAHRCTPLHLRHCLVYAMPVVGKAGAGVNMATRNGDIQRIVPLHRFSGAVVYGGMVYVSGVSAATADRDADAQTRAILEKMDGLLERCGTHKSRVVSATVWLARGASLAAMNAAWDAWIDRKHMPARTCVRSDLVVDDAVVEIQVIAALPTRADTEIVQTTAAAAAVGPYNQAVITNDDTVYVSGCIGLLPGSGDMVGPSVDQQAHQALNNLRAILDGAGCQPADIVKTTILLDDMGDFAAINKIYADFFEGAQVPARSCFAAKQLPKGALVEIEAIAKKKS